NARPLVWIIRKGIITSDLLIRFPVASVKPNKRIVPATHTPLPQNDPEIRLIYALFENNIAENPVLRVRSLIGYIPSPRSTFRIGAAHLYRGRFIQDEDGTQNWNTVLGIACCTQADIDRKAWGVPRININGISGIGNNYPIPQPRGETNFT